MKKRIYFARHGESQANLLHEISNRGLRHGLTPQGRAQAQALARRLDGMAITQIYSSPLLRAIETSVILANQLSLDYETSERLCEFDCGILEGLSDEAAWLAWQELLDAWIIRHAWERRMEGGESFLDIQARFTTFIDGLMQRYGETKANVVCVAHGGLFRTMLPVALKNANAELISRYGFEYSACIVAEWRPTGLFCVEWNGHALEPAWDSS